VNELAPISFPIPLEQGGNAVLLSESETSEGTGAGGCTGTIENPTAPEGTLCLYTSEAEYAGLPFPSNVISPGPAGEPGQNEYGPTGAYVFAFISGTEANPGKAIAHGTWAVTSAKGA
jgi:hypothetical protein